MNDLKAKDKEIERLSSIIANLKTASLLDGAISVGECRLIVANLGEATVDELRKTCDMIKSKGEEYIGVVAGIQKEKGSGNICVCCGKKAVLLGAHSGKIAKEIAMLAGGDGGGKPDSAMAGIKNTSALDDALSHAESIVKSFLN